MLVWVSVDYKKELQMCTWMEMKAFSLSGLQWLEVGGTVEQQLALSPHSSPGALWHWALTCRHSHSRTKWWHTHVPTGDTWWDAQVTFLAALLKLQVTSLCAAISSDQSQQNERAQRKVISHLNPDFVRQRNRYSGELSIWCHPPWMQNVVRVRPGVYCVGSLLQLRI